VSALVAALVLGKRKDFGKTAIEPHNLVLTLTGTSLLWVGWFGFNAGSAGAANALAAVAMANTQVAAAAAALTWMFVEWAVRGRATIVGTTRSEERRVGKERRRRRKPEHCRQRQIGTCTVAASGCTSGLAAS